MVLIRFLFGVNGRLDRRGYGLTVFGWLVLIAISQKFIAGLPDFATSGRILNLMWDGDAGWGPVLDAAVHAAGDIEIRYGALGALLAIAFASFLALTARRLHDFGRPAGYAWVAVLPFLGLQAVFYVLLLLPGDATANRYGAAGSRWGESPDTAGALSAEPTSP